MIWCEGLFGFMRRLLKCEIRKMLAQHHSLQTLILDALRTFQLLVCQQKLDGGSLVPRRKEVDSNSPNHMSHSQVG